VELGTAYSELTDPVEQRRRLQAQSMLAAGGDPEKRARTIPTQRMITPEEVARTCVFLADPIGALTGHTIVVDGGSVAVGCYA
jgi:NAD(P)-dependent dehydrogenase (short-subunit alcohol dehydrogenase family)